MSLLTSEASFAGSMTLYRPSGASLGNPGFTKTNFAMLTPTLPETGTYTIEIRGTAAEIGSVKLTAYTVEDISGSITPTEAGANQSVSLTMPGQVARYSISGTAGQKVSIRTSKPAFPASLAYYVELLDPTGKQIGFKWWWGTNSGYWQLFQLPSTGTYTLVVDGETSATGSVDLTVWDAPDITGGTITPTTEGESKTFQVKAAGQRNLVTFSGTKDQKVSLVSSESSFSGTMKLLRPSGASIGEPSFTKTNKAVISGATLPEAGTYTIQLEGTGAEVGSTKITAYTVEDISGSITPTEEGAKQSVSLPVPGQVARYSISGTAGQKISIKRSNVSITGDGYYTQLYDPTGKQIDSIWQWGYQSGFWKTFQLASTGTYTLLTKLEGPHTGSLDLTVWDAPDITGGTITPTTEGESKTFQVKAAGQRNLVTFSGTKDQKISVVSSEATFGGTFKLLSPTGAQVSSASISKSAKTLISAATLPETGTYTIQLEGTGAEVGSTKITAYTVEDISGSITPTEEGAKQSVSLPVPGQVARYSISGTAGQKISIKRSNVSITGDGYYTQLYDPTGKQIDSIWQWGYQSGFWKTFQLASTGTYTLLTKLEGPHTGSLDLTVWDAPDITGGTITPTTEGESKTFQVKAAGQRNLVTMAGTSGQLITLKVTEPTFAGSMSTWTSGGTKVTNSEKTFSSGGTAKAEITLPSTDTYTIRLEGTSGATGTLKLSAWLGSHAAWMGPMEPTYELVSLIGPDLDGMQIAYSDIGRPAARTALASFSSDQAANDLSPSSGEAPPDVEPTTTESPPSAGTTSASTEAGATDETRSPSDQDSSDPTPTPGQSLQEWSPRHPGAWLPPRSSLTRGWLVGDSPSPWEKVMYLRGEAGKTALSGQVLKVDGLPLVGARVSIEGSTVAAETDDAGRFLLEQIPAGRQKVVAAGETVAGENRYGSYEMGVEITSRKTTKLDYTVWMTPLDEAGDHHVPSPTEQETRLTTPRIPGFEVWLPAGTTITDPAGRTVEDLNITAIPVDRSAFPLPPFLSVPIYFTVQPGRAYLSKGAQVIYPNWGHLPPGQRVEFWNYDPSDRGWHVYGHGTVTPDGEQVMPDPGVRVWQFTGAMVTVSQPPPNSAAIPGAGATGGDPVDLYTGLFVYRKTDLVIPDTIPIVIQRTYRPGDSNSYGFGVGANNLYNLRLYSTNSEKEADLILPDGGRVHYVRTSPGSGEVGAVYEATSLPNKYSKSVITWDTASSRWNLKLTNGITYVFDPFVLAPLREIRDRYGNALIIDRTAGQSGVITQITSPNGRWVKFAYDGSNRVTKVTDNSGRQVKYTYTSGALTKVEAPAARTTEYEYDGSGRMKAVINARGNKYLQNEYDANGRVKKQVMGDGGAFEFGYDLDEEGQVEATTVTDTLGDQRMVEFDAEGFPVKDTRAFGTEDAQVTSFERQAETGLVLSTADPLGRKTSFEYDSSGNVIEVTQLDGTEDAVATKLAYQPGTTNVTEVTDPLGHTTELAYGAKGELLKQTDALENETTFEYGGDGQLTSTTNAEEEETTLGYAHGDLVSVTDPLGRTTRQFVDAVGRVRAITSPGGERTQLAYNDAGDVTIITSPSGAHTAIEYDKDGDITSITDPRENETTATYDVMDRLESETNPLEDSAEWSYDKAGNVVESVSRSGEVSEFGYDSLGRLASASFGVEGEAAESTMEYSYDDGDRLIGIDDSASGEYVLDYDELDRLTEISGPNGAVAYVYDDAGRRAIMSAPGQEPLGYEYDGANRLTDLARGGEAVSLAYDDASRLSSVTLPNGIEQLYGYDKAGQPTSITYKDGESTLGDLQYAYDVDERSTAAMWGSLARLALPEATPPAEYNAADQLTDRGEEEFDYDPNGNLVDDGASEYEWDARGQLSAIKGGASASFAYDPFGRRVSKTLGEATTGLLYDGPNVVQESSGEELTATLLTGLQPDQLFSRSTGEGTESYLTNLLGSPIALTDGSGEVDTSYTYEPFGAATSEGAESDNPFQFTGRENDGTGLQYNRARYYDPANARFISPDPAGFGGSGSNLYNYVGGNPLDFTDPAGEYPWGVQWPDPVGAIEDAISDAASSAGTVAWEHRREIGAAGVGVTCAISGGTTCLAVAGSGAALAALDAGVTNECGSDLIPAATAAGTTVVGALPGLPLAGLEAAGKISLGLSVPQRLGLAAPGELLALGSGPVIEHGANERYMGGSEATSSC